MDEFNSYRGLWSAVILQAFRDLKDPRERQRAWDWIFDPRPVGEGGFKWVCTMLDLDREWLRNKATTRQGIDYILWGANTKRGGKNEN